MSPQPDDPSDISQRIVKPRQLWAIVFGGVGILILVGFALLMGRLLRSVLN
mgnify:CR=1 FL=1